MKFEPVILSFGVSVALITLARRYKNNNTEAGSGTSGWGIFFLVIFTIAMLVIKYG